MISTRPIRSGNSSEAPVITPAEIGALARRIDRPIVLIGLMGVGKSTVGRKLADLLDTGFIDADEAIETAAQRSVSEIFEAHGEAYFRDGERRVIARLMAEGHGVIATGGGAFVDAETRAMILDHGVTVWIRATVETLVKRTGRRNSRPLLRDGDPQAILNRLADERDPLYRQAPIHVNSEEGPHHATALRILEGIERWL
ncbi:shikimate kinase [Altererythrobacter sp. SALINAS58]|uniref:shikimate kinase n=1 Tax=Alteripontixanthobacter muriae TaxID=2705546 RepID=UPI001574F6B3|nr:shikimate kinase [Alteripontixanthobacter muriae]NTZ42063.1 shikimate kinase [Alteripontixanthobacter muriae]